MQCADVRDRGCLNDTAEYIRACIDMVHVPVAPFLFFRVLAALFAMYPGVRTPDQLSIIWIRQLY